ncbi:hypothetical protein C9374_011141 [Naegleria lovaniensis]|uniref:Signal recognition particle 54 kDa protein n=1 Tax=Naegleria lovaniensis TaxID=51637 RepID=A0AA88KIL5_NAELO|nr:uncharacterized protein C9374_011141 [Naegleria lovaniensis]KAG2374062.1 hypothetical protein C9374_011141 [Naegleria lovaniensis]
MVLAELGSRITNALRNINTQVIDDNVINELLKEIGNSLMAADVNIQQVIQLRNGIKSGLDFDKLPKGINRRNHIKAVVYQELCKLLDPGVKPFQPVKGKQNVVMFVGLQGAGKTTTCTKFARYYQKKGFRAALVCADTFRAGALAQLKQNAAKVQIAFYGDEIESNPVKIAKDGVEQFKNEKYELIIVDTSGRHKQEESLFEEMEQVAEAVKPDEVIFVMDSSIGQSVKEQAAAFKSRVAVGSVIVTKLDGHAKGGGALSAVAATKSPITFIGTGEEFDDFQPFEAQSFVSRLLGHGDIPTLLKTVQEAVDPEKQRKMAEGIAKGIYTMRDMREHFTSIMKMGPLSQVMSMIPGFSEQLLPKGSEQEGNARLKKYLTIMDSFNDEEMDCTDITKLPNMPSRIMRIARGSGKTPKDVQELLEQFKLFQSMIGKLGSLNLNNIKSQKDIESLQKKLPGVMKGMPGMGNMDMNAMMKQMAKGGMPNLGGMNLNNLMSGLGNMLGGGGGGMDLSSMLGSFGMGGGGASGGTPQVKTKTITKKR